MIRCFKARQFFFLFLVTLIWFLISGLGKVYAEGKKEDTLSTADTLIAERRYNEAILLLTQYIKNNPDRFDDAQRRLQRIIKLREDYNKIAGDLLNILVSDPTNDERKLAMIRQLEGLEAAPNRAAREFILKTKETALFTYNRAQFEKIMADGRTLIDKGDYGNATKRYTDGFSLYREEFYQAGYGDIVVNSVNKGLKDIQQYLITFNALQPELQKRIDTFINLTTTISFSTNLEPILESYTELEALLYQYANVRNALASIGRGFESQFALLQSADPTLGDSSFLPFAFRFILGRKTEIQPEGIVGALDTFWIKGMNSLENALIHSLNGLYARYYDEYQNNPLVLEDPKIEKLSALSNFTLRVFSVWSSIAVKEFQYQVTNYGKSIAVNKIPIYLSVQALLETTTTLNDYYKVLKDYLVISEQQKMLFESWKAGQASQDGTIAGLQRGRENLINLRNALKIYEDIAAKRLQNYSFYQENGIDLGSGITQLQNGVKSLVFLEQHINDQELSLVSQKYTVENAGITTILNTRTTAYDKALNLIQGMQISTQNGSTYLAKYPKESLPLFNELDRQLSGDIQKARSVLSTYAAEPLVITNDVALQILRKETSDLLRRLEVLQSQVRTNSSIAQQQSALADSLKLEGDRRYLEAQTALRNLNFDLARQRLQQSGERYDASLAVQESFELRSLRDQRLLSLATEISKTENETVVRDVRRLITEAKRAYFTGDFIKAEDTLLQAQNRWKTTNVDDEPEVAYWLTLARSALSIKTGRTIPITAPLYPEMSQLLNAAQQAFEAGRSLLAAKKRTEALEQFDIARKKIQEVRILFPLNQEAGLLELQIDQLIDPAAFAANFRDRLSAAQAKLAAQPQEGYAELQDLYTINPNYPGLKAIIERAEIQLGLRLPPPDPRAIARSNELVAAAKRIIDTNTRSQFPVALAQLNEALKLNPNNEQAVALKDRIQTDVGGQATVVLSSAAEREYQRAVQELQNGNTIVALAIVEQLLQDPKNKNSTKLVELQKRIQSRL
ncbi:hypothetical protein [Gracilinema caldarium]|uniref:Tetratricopeptide repeat protein n=1 Tax=Gracilinema caldarium (strain ATCC 51460 / DSM 7334 / H1) TaxID=744872 RepID=F8EXH4_GRAC1|nr:hypothetical protein [Gracilinema caldarium]AEJ19201.1 hypothetical protein Spica_1052 [Gracilinema caldarium DSM 7334]